MVDLATLLCILTAYCVGCYSARRNLTAQCPHSARCGPNHMQKYFCTVDRALENPRQRSCSAPPPRQQKIMPRQRSVLTHNFSQPLIATIRLSRFLTALTNETPQTISRSFCILFDTSKSPARCKHLYGNNKSRCIRSSKQHNTKPRDMWARYLIRGRLSRFCAEWWLLLLPRVPNRVENLERSQLRICGRTRQVIAEGRRILVMIRIFSQDFSYNQYFSFFFIVYEVVWTHLLTDERKVPAT